MTKLQIINKNLGSLTQKKHTSIVKVRYAETDQMGVVHHANYPIYCELGRTEWLESLGVSYKEMEEGGLMLPLSQMQVTYHKPAKYNDKLFIETSLNYIKGARIEFAYTILNSDSQTLVTATTTLVFVNKKTGRPTRCPDDILEVLS